MHPTNDVAELSFSWLSSVLLCCTPTPATGRDQVVADAMYKLKARGLTMQNIVHMPDAELDGYIAKVGFHNNKASFASCRLSARVRATRCL